MLINDRLKLNVNPLRVASESSCPDNDRACLRPHAHAHSQPSEAHVKGNVLLMNTALNLTDTASGSELDSTWLDIRCSVVIAVKSKSGSGLIQLGLPLTVCGVYTAIQRANLILNLIQLGLSCLHCGQSFLPHLKNMHERLIEPSKLSLGLNMSAIGWHPVQGGVTPPPLPPAPTAQ